MLDVPREHTGLHPLKAPGVFHRDDGIRSGDHAAENEAAIKVALVPRTVSLCAWRSATGAARVPREQHPYTTGDQRIANRTRAAAGDAGAVFRSCRAVAGGCRPLWCAPLLRVAAPSRNRRSYGDWSAGPRYRATTGRTDIERVRTFIETPPSGVWFPHHASVRASLQGVRPRPNGIYHDSPTVPDKSHSRPFDR
jgi:hypothetical protein